MVNLKQIKRSVRSLSPKGLRRLNDWLHELIEKAEAPSPKESSARKQIVEERTLGNKTYRLEGVRCGKEKCKCASGSLHGPYWYSYVRIRGKLQSQYVGKKLPREIEKGLKQ